MGVLGFSDFWRFGFLGVLVFLGLQGAVIEILNLEWFHERWECLGEVLFSPNLGLSVGFLDLSRMNGMVDWEGRVYNV